MQFTRIADPTFARIAIRECVRDALGLVHPAQDPDCHLRAAIEWLVLAQDQTGNGGVSAGFGRRGWRPDYPETTGYIIPTFLDYWHLTGNNDLLDRALRMGAYEMRVQNEDGAIPGGYAQPRSPCVFDTGQVILGWLALYQETGQVEYLRAARLAGDWLRRVQARDGSWPSFDHAGSARAYHSRVAWALIALGQASGEQGYIESGRSQLDWTMTTQRPNGWFDRAELRGEPYPVTHTIAYTIRGLLESAAALQDSRYLECARRAADALRHCQLKDGSLPGRFDSCWRPRSDWSCLTGCAQMSLNWLRIYELTGESAYMQAGLRSNSFVRKTQNLRTSGPDRGAIKGSWPCYGEYERLSYPNWAAKFFADALMLEIKVLRARL
ncbi:MAG: hypothetical protein HXY20_09800 [Acidobacteria bacterium]|nr:hypothetical protein [Acidobacteriota bacterium]